MSEKYALKTKNPASQLEVIRLSASKLDVLVKCPLCFYNANKNELKRPTGAFPSLPRGIDRVLKAYYDNFRGTLPPELEGMVPGVLYQNMEKLTLWREWRTGLRFKDAELAVEVVSAFDDLLIELDGDRKLHYTLDYKSKSSLPKTNGAEYYQVQADIYQLCLHANNYPVNGRHFLVYYFPDHVAIPEAELSMSRVVDIKFGTKVFEFKASHENGRNLVKRACEVLRNPNPPAPALDCEFCAYAIGVGDVIAAARAAGISAKQVADLIVKAAAK